MADDKSTAVAPAPEPAVLDPSKEQTVDATSAEAPKDAEPSKEVTDEATAPVVGAPSAPAQPVTTAPEAVPAGADTAESRPEAQKEAGAESKDDPAKEPESSTAEATNTQSPLQELWVAAKAHTHPEIWGVILADPAGHVPSQIVFQKYLNANDGDLTKAKDQLLKTLAWRAEAKPLELVTKSFNKTKFDGLGYVTSYQAKATGGGDNAAEADPEKREVFTWNIYGAAAKRMTETFGDLDAFIEWRVALMELALRSLDLASATRPITAEWDPYKLYQVHDYQSISFFRQSAEVKAASTKTVGVFAQNYPELLKEKYFVNVPAIMGFMYTFMKLFVAAKTAKKFHPLTYGSGLAKELVVGSGVEGLGEMLPSAYGGKGGDLAGQGEQTQFAEVEEPKEVVVAKEAEQTEEAKATEST